jgi:hypothetical protein
MPFLLLAAIPRRKARNRLMKTDDLTELAEAKYGDGRNGF